MRTREKMRERIELVVPRGPGWLARCFFLFFFRFCFSLFLCFFQVVSLLAFYSSHSFPGPRIRGMPETRVTVRDRSWTLLFFFDSYSELEAERVTRGDVKTPKSFLRWIVREVFFFSKNLQEQRSWFYS